MKSNYLKHIEFIISVYLLGIIFFTLFRLGLLFTELGQLDNLPSPFTLTLQAMWMGFRFDTVISGYILFFPAILLSIISPLRIQNKLTYNIITIYLSILYSLSFLICAANIPYFNHYFANINIMSLAWIENPKLMFGMIAEEKSFFVYFFVFLIVATLFIYLLNLLKKKILINKPYGNFSMKKIFGNIGLSMLMLLLLFAGIRGRLAEKSPIRVGTAYFSPYAFPNQLGLNPVFVFMRSALDNKKEKSQEINLMDNDTAIKMVQQYFNINPDGNNASPIQRHIKPDTTASKYNIVIVLMESMSAANLSRNGNTDNLTPNLDELANKSYYFNNFYSAGIHTFNGIFSSLYSYPALLNQHPMRSTLMNTYSGISHTLSDNDYYTMFFITHDGQFDNAEGFLYNNGFNRVYSQKDYPASEVLSTLGVPDHYLFDFSIEKMNNAYKSGKPFLSVMLTASNHKPVVIPENIDFTPRSADKSKHINEYADWAVGKFIKDISQYEWFDNTIFIFTGDHGNMVNKSVYDIPIEHNYIPLLIYAPKILKPQVFDNFGGQIDIYPTVMGLLNIEYDNNTLGVDILKKTRPCMYFSADDKIACLNNDFLYVYRKSGIESLYKYRQNDTKDYSNEYPAIADSLKNYAFSMMQVSQYMIKNKLTE